jgi:hypothetical protein
VIQLTYTHLGGVVDPKTWELVCKIFPELGAPGITRLWTDSTHFLLRYDTGGNLTGVLSYTPSEGDVTIIVSPEKDGSSDVFDELWQAACQRWTIEEEGTPDVR